MDASLTEKLREGRDSISEVGVVWLQGLGSFLKRRESHRKICENEQSLYSCLPYGLRLVELALQQRYRGSVGRPLPVT